MPALVSSKVGSPLGIKEELGIVLCPFPSKKLKNAARISSIVIITYDFTGKAYWLSKREDFHLTKTAFLPRPCVI